MRTFNGTRDWMIDRRQEECPLWIRLTPSAAPEGRLLILVIISSVLLLGVILIILHLTAAGSRWAPPPPRPPAAKRHIYTKQVTTNILLFAAWRPLIHLKAGSVSA